MSSTGPYKIRGDDPADWLYEANRVFELIAERLDSLEGYRGHAKFYNYMETSSDVVIQDATKGIILKDNTDPPNYWRITINSAGTLVVTNIGRVYP